MLYPRVCLGGWWEPERRQSYVYQCDEYGHVPYTQEQFSLSSQTSFGRSCQTTLSSEDLSISLSAQVCLNHPTRTEDKNGHEIAISRSLITKSNPNWQANDIAPLMILTLLRKPRANEQKSTHSQSALVAPPIYTSLPRRHYPAPKEVWPTGTSL